MQDLAGKKVLIAGGTGEVGQVVSSHFVALGAEVVVTYLSEGQLSTFNANYPDEVKKIYFERLNALEMKKVKHFLEGLAAKKGVPDILVNLIGGFTQGPSVSESEMEHFNAMLDLNFRTTFNMCRCTLPHMLKSGRGKIINVGARTGLAGEALMAPYSIAKAAVIRLTESISAEVKGQGVNVNCVLPSVIDTRANRQDLPDEDFTNWVAPIDLARVITFLGSESSRAIHGAAIPVYGGV